MTERISALLAELRDGLKTIYGVRLRGVYLYGSYARGEEDDESDIDVLVVLDGMERYGAEIEQTSRLVAEVSLRHGVSISRVFVPETVWSRKQTPFLANVREEAVPL